MSLGITNLLLVFFYRTIGTANYDAIYVLVMCRALVQHRLGQSRLEQVSDCGSS